MASTACFCGAVFVTVEALHNHATSRGHLFACGCGTVVATRNALSDHKRKVGHALLADCDRYLDLDESYTDPCKCAICTTRLPFKDEAARDHHNADKHKACPACSQIFDSTVYRLRHQKAANHCYCAEHNEAFNRPEDLAEHKRADAHVSSFECAECQRSFTSDKALEHHLVSGGHQKIIDDTAAKEAESKATAIKLAQLEESNLRCEACNRSFKHLRAFRQHKDSLKHKPLSELKCPVSVKCTGTFTSPSALLFHLESGHCKGGMTHSKLNAIVYQHDTDRNITSVMHVHRVLNTAASEAAHSTIGPGSSASNRARSVSGDSSGTGMAGSNAATPSGSNVDLDVRSVSEDSSVLNGGGAVLTPSTRSSSTPEAAPNKSEIDYDVRSVSDDPSVLNGGGAVLTPTASTKGSHAATPNSNNTDQDVHSVGDDSSLLNNSGVFPTPSTSTSSSSTHDTHTLTSSVVSSDGSIILTPPASLSSSAALGDWSFLHSSTNIPTPIPTSLDGSSVDTITFDTALQRWPCPSCLQKFRKRHDLTQHMNSVVHAPKVFHCPTDLPGLPGNKLAPTLHFKTLSGLAQHVEAGSCKGGKAMLGFIVGLFEKQIEAKMGKSVKLLKA